MARRYRRYLVGFDTERDPVYGRDLPNLNYADPMTLKEARRDLRKGSLQRVIYQLMPVTSTEFRRKRRPA